MGLIDPLLVTSSLKKKLLEVSFLLIILTLPQKLFEKPLNQNYKQMRQKGILYPSNLWNGKMANQLARKSKINSTWSETEAATIRRPLERHYLFIIQNVVPAKCSEI